MTWLKGNTTWGNLATDLTKLVCGEIADGVGTTCATGDRWVRDVTRTVTDAVLNSTTTVTSATAAFTSADVGAYLIATGVPSSTTIASVTNATTVVLSVAATASASGVTAKICLDTIRTPAAKDVATGACANRTGYFASVGLQNSATPMAGSLANSAVCRVTNPFTSEPSPQSFHRWYVSVQVAAVNTVSGNYSNAMVQVIVYNGDVNTSGGASNLTPNAAGVVIATNGLQVTVSDPSGFLPLNTSWYRAFSTTYMYGIDAWPMLYRAAGATTFGTAPPGVAGTDYDIVFGGNIGGPLVDRGGLFCGLGIKTATGLGAGALYTVNENMALAKCRIFNSATVGILSLDFGGSRMDPAASGTIRCVGGHRITSWLRPFQTAGSVTATSLVQYYISVKNDGIVVVLNGDTAATGKLTTAYIGTCTPVEPTYDLLPVLTTYFNPDYTADIADATGIHWMMATQYGYWALRRRQDGSEGTRDWQTKWMRGEGQFWTGSSGQAPADIGGSGITTGYNSVSAYALSPLGGAGYPTIVSFPARQNKPGPDGKWWMYGYTFAELDWSSPVNQGSSVESRIVRGTQNTRFLYIPSDGWGSGDELTDTVTGTKYLLVIPDYPGIGCRVRVAPNSYFGGLAVAEI